MDCVCAEKAVGGWGKAQFKSWLKHMQQENKLPDGCVVTMDMATAHTALTVREYLYRPPHTAILKSQS